MKLVFDNGFFGGLQLCVQERESKPKWCIGGNDDRKRVLADVASEALSSESALNSQSSVACS